MNTYGTRSGRRPPGSTGPVVRGTARRRPKISVNSDLNAIFSNMARQEQLQAAEATARDAIDQRRPGVSADVKSRIDEIRETAEVDALLARVSQGIPMPPVSPVSPVSRVSPVSPEQPLTPSEQPLVPPEEGGYGLVGDVGSFIAGLPGARAVGRGLGAGLEAAERFYFDPVATGLIASIQQAIPGYEGQAEREQREAIEELDAAHLLGLPFYGTERWRIGMSVGAEDPGGHLSVSLPFTVESPDWLVGRDRTLKDIEISGRTGIKVVADPFNVVTIPLGAPIKAGVRVLNGMRPGSSQWINTVKNTPGIAEDAAELARRHEQRLIGHGFAVKGPPIEPPPPGPRRAGARPQMEQSVPGGWFPDTSTSAGIRRWITSLERDAGLIERTEFWRRQPEGAPRLTRRTAAADVPEEMREAQQAMRGTEAQFGPGVTSASVRAEIKSAKDLLAATLNREKAEQAVTSSTQAFQKAADRTGRQPSGAARRKALRDAERARKTEQKIRAASEKRRAATAQKIRAARSQQPLQDARRALNEEQRGLDDVTNRLSDLESRLNAARVELAGTSSLKRRQALTQRIADLEQQIPVREEAVRAASERVGFAKSELANTAASLRPRPEVPLDAPAVPPPPPEGNLAKAMAEVPEEKPKTSRGPVEAVRAAKVRVLEAFTDDFDGINAATRRADELHVKEFGEHLDDSMNAELHAHLLRAAPATGVKRFDEIKSAALRVLARGDDHTYVNWLLKLRFQESIFEIHPEHIVESGLKTVEEVRAAINEIPDIVGLQAAARIETAARIIRDGYRELLEAKVESGLVSRELADLLNDVHPWYNPIRLVDHIEDNTWGKNNRAISVSSDGMMELSKIGEAGKQVDPLVAGYHAMGRATLLIKRNDTARALVATLELDPKSTIRRLAEGEKLSPRTPSITTMVNGQPVVYEVPAWVEREAVNFAVTPMGALQNFAHNAQAPIRWMLTTYNPAFLAFNFVFDTVQSAMLRGVMPWSTGQALVKNLIAIVREDKVLNEMIKAGGDPSGYWGMNIQKMMQRFKDGGHLGMRSQYDYMQLLTRPWDTFKEIAHAAELAPRRALYERRLAKGDTVARAALAAKRGTMDFQRGGWAVRMADSLFIYVNPGVQGTMLPMRALWSGVRKGYDLGENSKAARYGLTGFLAAQSAAYAWNSQFEEYRNLPIKEKYGSLMIMTPSDELDRFGNTVPHRWHIVHNLREFAAFSAPIIRIYDQLRGTDVESFEDFSKTMVEQLNPASSITRLTVPTTALQLYTEVTMNFDTFRDRPIVPDDLVNLPPSEQFDLQTSETAKRVGSWLGYSPMKIDHLTHVGVTRDVIGLADVFLREQSGEDVQADAILAHIEQQRQLMNDDDYAIARNLILRDLDQDMRERVLDLERAPDPSAPFIGSIQKRFYRAYGGSEYYRAGIEAAARKGKLDAKQIRTVNARLGDLGDELAGEQVSRDRDFARGHNDRGEPVTGKDWRAGRRIESQKVAGYILSLGIGYPDFQKLQADPELMKDFYDTVATINGKIEDPRTRTELNLAAYRAIPIFEITPGVEDWTQHFKSKDDFLKTLSDAEWRDLQDRLRSRMTERERTYDDYVNPNGLARAYWDVAKDRFAELDDPAITQELFRSYEQISAGQSPEVQQDKFEFLQKYPSIEGLHGDIRDIRSAMRLMDPGLDAFLYRWEFTTALTNPANFGRENELRPSRAYEPAMLAIQ